MMSTVTVLTEVVLKCVEHSAQKKRAKYEAEENGAGKRRDASLAGQLRPEALR